MHRTCHSLVHYTRLHFFIPFVSRLTLSNCSAAALQLSSGNGSLPIVKGVAVGKSMAMLSMRLLLVDRIALLSIKPPTKSVVVYSDF
jgi:hypothetical protein